MIVPPTTGSGTFSVGTLYGLRFEARVAVALLLLELVPVAGAAERVVADSDSEAVECECVRPPTVRVAG